MAKVILDAGHGGSDTGDNYYNRTEKNDNLRLTLRVGQLLENAGIQVFYTRVSDNYLPQLERVRLANNIGGDLLISFHRLFGRSMTSGPSSDFFLLEEEGIGYDAARNIGDNLSDIGFRNYGIIIRTDLPILSDTKVPGVMLGIGHIKSESENNFFDDNFETIASAIANGIKTTLLNQNIEASIIKNIPEMQKSSCNCSKTSHILELNNGSVKIILDPGHGGSEAGDRYGNNVEKDENLKLTLAVGEILSNRGIDVGYTRTSDVSLSSEERLQKASEEGGDLLLSIHRTIQLYQQGNTKVESLISGQNNLAKNMATNLNKSLVDVGYLDNGIIEVQSNIEIPGDKEIPQVILLTGIFGPNIKNLQFDEKFDETANAIAEGVIDTIQVKAQNIDSDYRYSVQVGLFRVYNNALNLQMKLMQGGYMAEIVSQGDLFAIYVGDFTCLDEAASLEQRLRILGYNTLLVAV
ncbi:MAG: N-acetylmuramoyl-L-alanine amidase [Mobilitalea sp.]